MCTQRRDELPVPCIPEFHVVVEARAGDEQAIRRKRDVVDLLLVAEEAGDGFGRRGWLPDVHCEIVGGGDEAFDGDVVDGSGFVEAGFRFLSLFGVGGRDGAGVVMVGGSEDEVG